MLWLCYTRRYSEGDTILELRGLRPHGDRVSVSFACVEWAFSALPSLVASGADGACRSLCRNRLGHPHLSQHLGLRALRPDTLDHGRALRGRLYARACAWRAHRLAAHAAVVRTKDGRGRLAHACAAGRDVLGDCRDPRDPGRDLRGGLAQSRCRGVVLGARANGAHQFGPCGRCLCRRAQAGHPGRHPRNGVRPRPRGSASANRPEADRRHPRDRSADPGVAGRLCGRFHRTDDRERQACHDARPRAGDAGTDRRGAERHSGGVQSRGAG